MRVRAVISAEVSDNQRKAIAAYYDGNDHTEYDREGNVKKKTRLRKASQKEVREYAETYGWSGLDGNLNDIMAAIGLDEE